MNKRRRAKETADHTDSNAADLDGSLKKLERLHRENEQLLRDVEDEQKKERELATLKVELQLALSRIADLEERLRQKGDTSKLRKELERCQARADRLRDFLETEKSDNRRLKSQVSELRLQNLRQSLKEQGDAGITSSMPDLHADPMGTSWTATSYSLGEHPELDELIRKHREVTRLNQELQRRCEDKLRGDKRPRPASAGQTTSYWQSRLRQQEDSLRAEMRQRESSLRAQVADLEERLREKEEAVQRCELRTRREYSAVISDKNEEIRK